MITRARMPGQGGCFAQRILLWRKTRHQKWSLNGAVFEVGFLLMRSVTWEFVIWSALTTTLISYFCPPNVVKIVFHRFSHQFKTPVKGTSNWACRLKTGEVQTNTNFDFCALSDTPYHRNWLTVQTIVPTLRKSVYFSIKPLSKNAWTSTCAAPEFLTNPR